ncbi:MAG: hypothetical protein IID32_01295 [Planctomycetes bacterium]|nr:hypothetical protein [Planctomycetota bacterium]
MNKKTQKKYVDTGFGFPVHLLNVPMVKVRGHWTPEINYAELSHIVIMALVSKPARLTGNELKYLRNKLEMNLQDFSDRFYVTHPAVIKWEKKKDKPTGMKWATEKDIRLCIYEEFDGENLSEIYNQLSHQASNKKVNTKIDVAEEEVVLV